MSLTGDPNERIILRLLTDLVRQVARKSETLIDNAMATLFAFRGTNRGPSTDFSRNPVFPF